MVGSIFTSIIIIRVTMLAPRRVADLKTVRVLNEARLLECLRHRDGVPRMELGKQTSLSFSTVSSLIKDFKSSGIIRTQPSASPGVGRIPEAIVLNPGALLTLAIDFTENHKLTVVALDMRGTPLRQWEIPVERGARLHGVLDRLATFSRTVLATRSFRDRRWLALTAIVPGIHYHKTECVVNSTNPLVDGTPLEKLLADRIALPPLVYNDANLAALGASLSRGPDASGPVAFLYVGEGLGLGLVDRNLVVGAHGFAGEIAHIPIPGIDRACYCGKVGCAETVASFRGILNAFYDDARPSADDSVKERDRVVQTLEAEGRKTEEIAYLLGGVLGRVVAILINLLDPAVLYIGFALPGFDRFLDKVHEKASRVATEHLLLPTSRVTSTPLVKAARPLIFQGCAEVAFAEGFMGVREHAEALGEGAS